jgi:hypothetical protein
VSNISDPRGEVADGEQFLLDFLKNKEQIDDFMQSHFWSNCSNNFDHSQKKVRAVFQAVAF